MGGSVPIRAEMGRIAHRGRLREAIVDPRVDVPCRLPTRALYIETTCRRDRGRDDDDDDGD
jgi:hypothetical protein